MDYQDRWDVIGELGKGGQGKVFRVLDKQKFDIEKKLYPSLQNSVAGLGGVQTPESRKRNLETFRKAVVEIIGMEDPQNHGALKELHKPEDARDYELAEARIKAEIKAMSEMSHPNLLPVLDHDPDGKWFVSQFYPKGTLKDNHHLFMGDFIGALRAIRPLVEGVSKLHKQKWVHRDIKPENVFIDNNGGLVLGDFGLVFFADSQHTRISHTWENVGSRDWMPGWAMGMRIEEIRPAFDVFALGKLLWAMVSETSILQLWYYDHSKFNLVSKFPRAPYMNIANQLFKRCIVQYEHDCLPDATALLEEIDNVLLLIERGGDSLNRGVQRPCKVCGIGTYNLKIDEDSAPSSFTNFGLHPAGIQRFKIFVCNHCGNVQLFSFSDRKAPSAWSA